MEVTVLLAIAELVVDGVLAMTLVELEMLGVTVVFTVSLEVFKLLTGVVKGVAVLVKRPLMVVLVMDVVAVVVTAPELERIVDEFPPKLEVDVMNLLLDVGVEGLVTGVVVELGLTMGFAGVLALVVKLLAVVYVVVEYATLVDVGAETFCVLTVFVVLATARFTTGVTIVVAEVVLEVTGLLVEEIMVLVVFKAVVFFAVVTLAVLELAAPVVTEEAGGTDDVVSEVDGVGVVVMVLVATLLAVLLVMVIEVADVVVR